MHNLDVLNLTSRGPFSSKEEKQQQEPKNLLYLFYHFVNKHFNLSELLVEKRE